MEPEGLGPTSAPKGDEILGKGGRGSTYPVKEGREKIHVKKLLKPPLCGPLSSKKRYEHMVDLDREVIKKILRKEKEKVSYNKSLRRRDLLIGG